MSSENYVEKKKHFIKEKYKSKIFERIQAIRTICLYSNNTIENYYKDMKISAK